MIINFGLGIPTDRLNILKKFGLLSNMVFFVVVVVVFLFYIKQLNRHIKN